MRKGLLSPDEDERLVRCITKYVNGSWSDIARKAGLDRCGKSCRRRWMNHLRPDLKRGKFSMDEIFLIIQLQETLGNRWSDIASHLEGRTDNDVKNLWNTQIKKRLPQLKSQMQNMNFSINLQQRAGSSTVTTTTTSTTAAQGILQSSATDSSTYDPLNSRLLLDHHYNFNDNCNINSSAIIRSAEGMDQSEYMMIKMEFPDAIIGPSTTSDQGQGQSGDAVSDLCSSAHLYDIHDHDVLQRQPALLTKASSSTGAAAATRLRPADHDYCNTAQQSTSANSGKNHKTRNAGLPCNYNSWPGTGFNINHLISAAPTDYLNIGNNILNSEPDRRPTLYSPRSFNPNASFTNSYDKVSILNSVQRLHNNQANEVPELLHTLLPAIQGSSGIHDSQVLYNGRGTASTTMSQIKNVTQPEMSLINCGSGFASSCASVDDINMLALAAAAATGPTNPNPNPDLHSPTYKPTLYNMNHSLFIPPPPLLYPSCLPASARPEINRILMQSHPAVAADQDSMSGEECSSQYNRTQLANRSMVSPPHNYDTSNVLKIIKDQQSVPAQSDENPQYQQQQDPAATRVINNMVSMCSTTASSSITTGMAQPDQLYRSSSASSTTSSTYTCNINVAASKYVVNINNQGEVWPIISSEMQAVNYNDVNARGTNINEQALWSNGSDIMTTIDQRRLNFNMAPKAHQQDYDGPQ